jgi:hypothetical protein
VVVVLGVAGIGVAIWAQAQPVIDADQASSLALDQQAGPTHADWRADSETLDYSGNRPPPGNLPGAPKEKCWGAMLPMGDGYCLPYPMWRVHLVGPVVGGQCSDRVVYVDGRKARAVLSRGHGGPCSTFTPSS